MTQIIINISGIIPINPWNEFDRIFGSNLVESLIAVGANNMKTPILQMSNSNINGTILNMIEGMLEKYF